MKQHFTKRYPSSIKYYNFLKTNQLAPLVVKLKALEACALSSLLHNCETFGNKYPKEIEKVYINMIKAALNVRPSTPNALVIIESGLKPLKAIIYARQLNFYKRFKNSLSEDGVRHQMMDIMTTNPTQYIRHYIDLENQYQESTEIYKKFDEELKSSIRKKVDDGCYKFQIYLKINPQLERSPYLHENSAPITNDIIRFRLGSHYLPIEIGRWSRTPRTDRKCIYCDELGDEAHYIYKCTLISRDGMILPVNFQFGWNDAHVLGLFRKLKGTDLL